MNDLFSMHASLDQVDNRHLIRIQLHGYQVIRVMTSYLSMLTITIDRARLLYILSVIN